MQRNSGFTLIEVLVTVAIIAILAAIAIPNYTSYVKRAQIAEAGAALLAMRTKMEQWFQDNRTYPATCGANTTATQIAKPTLKYFTISCTLPDSTHYTLSADGGTPGDASMTGIHFTINEANQRATTVDPGSTMAKSGYSANLNCWTPKKGGVC